MPGILVVHGGAERARRVFAAEGRADWSQGLGVVLEKHGLLEFETGGPEVLSDAGALRRYDCVLVAELDAAHWTRDALAAVRTSGTPLLAGAPPPPHVLGAFGVTASEAGPASIAIGTADARLRALAEAYGAAPGGRLGPPRSRAVPRDPASDWQRLPGVPLTARQARAWGAQAPGVERWALERDARALAVWSARGEQWPAIVRCGRLHACAFGLFAALAQAHTSEPWDHGEFRSSGRTLGLEVLLLGLIDLLHEQCDASRARILPWPRGATWALTVRHDVDRPMQAAEVTHMLRGHARSGTAATWYWRACHLERGRWLGRMRARRAVRRVAATAGHEVAHHTEALWAGADGEQSTIEAAMRDRVAGTSAHGDPGCFRFQGAPNVLWAERQGLLYTELLQQAHVHPHRFLALGDDGVLEISDVVCLPHHESFDRSTRPGDHCAADILERAPGYVAAGGLLQVMNHPDLNREALFAMLAALPHEGRWNCTARQAAGWWRRTHAHDRLRIERGDDGAPRLGGEDRVSGVTLEIATPDGHRSLSAPSGRL